MYAPILTGAAFASRMDGKGMGCSGGMNCMQERYYAAKGHHSTKPKKHPK